MNSGLLGFPRRTPTYRELDVRAPLVSPSPLDDEFDYDFVGTAPPGWANLGTLTQTCTVRGGSCLIETPASASFLTAAIGRVLPAGPFTVVTSATLLRTGNFNAASIGVYSTVSGRRAGLSFNSRGVGSSATRFTYQKYPSFSARDVAVDSGDFYAGFTAFLAMMYDGTNLYYRYSYNGRFWDTILTESIGSYFTGGNLPNMFVLELRSETSNTPLAEFHFARYSPRFEQNLTRFVNREF